VGERAVDDAGDLAGLLLLPLLVLTAVVLVVRRSDRRTAQDR